MGIECGECEMDLRGGHADDCSRTKGRDREPEFWDAAGNPLFRRKPVEHAPDISVGLLVEKARGVVMTPEEAEVQRRSFAFGNVSMSNPAITREMIDRAAESIQTEHTAPQPAPKQDGNAPALWPAIIAEIEGPFGRIKNAPTARAANVERLMVADMSARHAFGVAKYGVPLVAHNDRDHLSDAYQKALDGVVYLRAEIEKRGGMKRSENLPLARLYAAQFKIAFDLRDMLARRDGR